MDSISVTVHDLLPAPVDAADLSIIRLRLDVKCGDFSVASIAVAGVDAAGWGALVDVTENVVFGNLTTGMIELCNDYVQMSASATNYVRIPRGIAPAVFKEAERLINARRLEYHCGRALTIVAVAPQVVSDAELSRVVYNGLGNIDYACEVIRRNRNPNGVSAVLRLVRNINVDVIRRVSIDAVVDEIQRRLYA